MGRSPDIATPDAPRWARYVGPVLGAMVAVSVLLGVLGSVLDSRFETQAHAQASYAAIDAAVAANRAECELRLEQSMGRIRVETAEIRGSVTRLERNIDRIDSTLQRVADKLGVPPALPGFVPLAAPPRQP